MSLRSDIMRFSVLGFKSDIRIELQAPVVSLWYAFKYSGYAADRYSAMNIKHIEV